MNPESRVDNEIESVDDGQWTQGTSDDRDGETTIHAHRRHCRRGLNLSDAGDVEILVDEYTSVRIELRDENCETWLDMDPDDANRLVHWLIQSASRVAQQLSSA